MTLIGRLHPLLVHFPIAFVLAAAGAEAAALVTGDESWRLMARRTVRIAGACAVVAAIAGWRLALDTGADDAALLEWHRWLGTSATAATVGAAIAASAPGRRRPFVIWTYRSALLAAAALVGITGHLGGVLAWGADFLRF
jgi:uncharacterized membrane protein